METLADALQAEIIRVRDKVMPEYITIGDAGAVGLTFMRADLNRATKALAEQDAVECLRAFEALKGYTV